MKLSLYVKESGVFSVTSHESQYWDPSLQVQVGFPLSFSLCRNLVVCHKYDMSFFSASTLWPMACFGWSSTHGMQHCTCRMLTKVYLSQCIVQMVWYPVHSLLFCGIYIAMHCTSGVVEQVSCCLTCFLGWARGVVTSHFFLQTPKRKTIKNINVLLATSG